MVYVLQSVLLLIVEITKLSLVMIGLLSYKPNRRFIPVYLVAQTVLGGFSFFASANKKQINIYDKDYLFTLIGILTIIVVALSMNGRKVFLISSISYAGVCLVDIICSGGIAIILNVNKDNAFQNFVFNLLPNLFSILLLASVYLLKRKINMRIAKAQISIHSRYIILVIFGFIGAGLYIAPIQMFGLLEHGTKVKAIIVLAVSLSGILFIVISVWLVIINDSKNHYKAMLEMNGKLIEQQKEHYRTLIEKEQYTKRFRHDINNHILCIKHLCEQQKYKELSEYLDDMQKYMESLKLNIQTGNEIVNIIVNDIYNKNDKIKIIWKGILPDKIKISNMDLCTIFSNLFSNAIEAVKKVDDSIEKIIEIQIRYLQDNLVILIKNPVVEKVKIYNQKLITTKENREQHGFGSINVESCVKKYHGNLHYQSTDQEFIVELIFCDIFDSEQKTSP